MPLTNFPLPLTRLPPWFPGQVGGIPGADDEQGLRVHCTGNVFYVDPNYPGAVTNRDGTDPQAPLSTVAAALTKCTAQHGDVIMVMANDAWQYASGLSYATPVQESVVVTVPGVTILGVARGSGLGVTWQPAAALGTCITVHAIDVRIAGFAFDAPLGGNGISAIWNGTTIWGENTIIEDCFFSGDIDIAVQLEYAWNCWIQRCVFQHCDSHGIYVDPVGAGAAYLHILDNQFQDCAVAMALNGVDDSEILHNRIFNANAQGGGAATDEGIDTTAGRQNLVADNWFSCLLPAGPGGWADLNSSAATDAWISNHCLDGDNVANP